MSALPPGGCFLFLGPDRAKKLQRIQALERAFQVDSLDRHQLDAASTTAAELIATCRQQPAASKLRLIVVEQAHKLDATGVKALFALADVIRRNACVVLMVETALAARHPLSSANPALVIEQFPGRDIAAAKPFALTDALGSRDSASAWLALREQLLAGKDPVELLGLIAWQLQRWVAVKRLSMAGHSLEELTAQTGLKQWQLQRIQAEISRRSLSKLTELLATCWELDVAIREGRLLPEMAVEQVISEVCLIADEPVKAGAK